MGSIRVSEKVCGKSINNPMTNTPKSEESGNHYLDLMRDIAEEFPPTDLDVSVPVRTQPVLNDEIFVEWYYL